ncbi:hypothetical protein CRENBAI_004512 [Crenichthys baileyi]|uniref:Uncharacterized protein n=1 Tax=Crenichthys baileyi TaxID=28760 RepID=A0AAV9R1D2_9TELE
MRKEFRSPSKTRLVTPGRAGWDILSYVSAHKRSPLKHPQLTTRKEWSSSSLCPHCERGVSSVTRDLSTNGHRLCGSDRHNYSTVPTLLRRPNVDPSTGNRRHVAGTAR